MGLFFLVPAWFPTYWLEADP